jgi:hypothetical protein
MHVETRDRGWSRLFAAAFCLALLGALFYVFARVRSPSDTFLWREILNLGHVPLFGCVALCLYGFVRNVSGMALSPRRRVLVSLVLAVAAGGIGEVAQAWFERDPDPWDYSRNLCGVLAALLLVASRLRDPSGEAPEFGPGARRAMRILAGGLALVFVVPFLVWCEAYRERDARFPVLYAFDSHLESLFYRTRLARIDLTSPPEGWTEASRSRVSAVSYAADRFPNLTFFEPESDWTGYRFVEIDSYLDAPEPRSVWFFVTDRQFAEKADDLFRTRLDLVPGPNRHRIPLDEVRHGAQGRTIDLATVDQMAIVGANRPPVAFTLFLAEIRLGP